VTAFLAILVATVFFVWLYLYESARLDKRERMSDQWIERWHREHR
jgi:hypothetical protein